MATYSEFKAALAARESGGSGDFQAENPLHYIGRYQFSEILLKDIGFYQKSGSLNNDWTGTWTAASGVSSKDEFLGKGAFDTVAGHTNAIAAQEAAIEAEFTKNSDRLISGGWAVYEGQILNSHQLTLSGMLGQIHLIGYTAFTQQFLKSGGYTDPVDGNGVKGSSYLDLFAGYTTPYDNQLKTIHTSAEKINGGKGHDELYGKGGNDTLNGGDDKDIAVYQGNSSDYSIEFLPDGSVKVGDKVAGRDDIDTLTDVETAKFADKSVSLAVGQDVAFVIDTTGSMFDDIDAVKAQSNNIIKAIFEGENSILNSRIAVVGYNDPSTSTYLSFTDQPKIEDRKSAALAGINSISVDGGGDWPEYTYSGLLRALDGSAGNWREEAVARKIILFGDAPAKDTHLASTVYSLAKNLNVETPSAPLAFSTSSISKAISLTSFNVSSVDVVTGAKTVMPVQIFSVAIGDDLEAIEEFQQIANATGGSAFTTTNASEIVDALLKIINLPIYTISTEISSIEEGNGSSQVVNFTISRDVSDAAAKVDLGRTGTLDESDFGVIPSSISFSVGETEKVLSITVNGDKVLEQDETLSLSITAVDEPATFGASSATLTVLNDDISGVNEVLGTSSRDNLVGTSDADTIISLAGSYDRMTGGEGADQFVFGAEARNGLRERDVVLDYEVGIDEIVLGEGVTVGSIRQSGDSVVVFLNDDKDAIYVNGEDVTIDNITILGAAPLAGPSSLTDFWGV